jgi:hypothetical protein
VIDRICAARPVALLACAGVLLACGGGGAEDRVPAQGERARAAAAQPVVVAAAAPAPIETPAHGCVRQVNVALKSKPAKVHADCLAGAYVGVDARGKECTLQIAANNGRFRFVERDKALLVEADAAAAGAAPVYAIERADVEIGQIGLMLTRRTAGGPDVETLELTAGETSKGPLDLAAATLTRVKSGDVKILRCFFDT